MSDLPTVSLSDHQGVPVVAPSGELDIAGADLLRSALGQALETDHSRVVLDLSAATFMDSVALGAVIGAGRRAAGDGGWVRLVAPPANIRRLLRMTEVDRVFGLYDTVDQAVAHDAGTSWEF